MIVPGSSSFAIEMPAHFKIKIHPDEHLIASASLGPHPLSRHKRGRQEEGEGH